MTDAELRGRLLAHFYNLRHNGGRYVPVSHVILSGTEGATTQAIGGVCRQLGDAGLIEWTDYLGDGPSIGSARITGLGVDAVETGKSARMEIQFPNRTAPPPSFMQQLDDPKRLSNSNPDVTHTQPSRKVFVVHGHDEGAREAVARFLAQIGFDPIILHEQASKGLTVIEKVETHAEVGFAVVLLTPDDEGNKKGKTPQPRARQNVILELGYFIGRLGRARVCALRRGDVEIPSDFEGVVYETFDDLGAWKSKLAKELAASNFDVDWTKVHT